MVNNHIKIEDIACGNKEAACPSGNMTYLYVVA
jgi:hypothetical protein